MRTNTALTDESIMDLVEWIDGERVPLDEYESRLQNQTYLNASVFLLARNPDLNWIFGIAAQKY